MKEEIKSDIAIVYPSCFAFKSNPKAKGWDIKGIHHGIGYIIAYAKKEGIDVDLIDLRRLKDWDDFIGKITNYSIVAFSVMTVDYPNAMKAIKITKAVNPKAKIIIGGVHPSVAVEDFIHNKDIDFIIQGEGEIAFVNLIKHILSNAGSRIVKGIPVDNLDDIPFIDRTLWEKEDPWPFKYKEPFVTILASRACIYGCKFCQPTARIMFGMKERTRSVNNVITELRLLREQYHFKSFMVHDDNFVQNKEWGEQFIKQFKENDFDVEFSIQARADLICYNEELIKKLAGIGLSYVMVGFESGSQRILNYLAKGTTVEQNIKASKILKENDIKVWANIMFGTPTETYDEAIQTEKMLDIIQPENLSMTYYTPYPGNFIAEECKKNNMILAKDYEEMLRYPSPKISGIDYKLLDNLRLKIAVKHALYNHDIIRFFWRLGKWWKASL